MEIDAPDDPVDDEKADVEVDAWLPVSTLR